MKSLGGAALNGGIMAIAGGWGTVATGVRPSEAVPLGGASIALLMLNLIDGVFTTVFLQLHLAEEANPLMRFAYEASPLQFMAVKLAVVQLGVTLLWLHRDSPLAQWATRAGAWLYAGIVCWHLAFAANLLFG